MYRQEFEERHKLGLQRLTGGNRGLVYANERQEVVALPVDDGEEPQERTMWVYDVYEVDDARTPQMAKDSVIGAVHPCGDEQKILRKTLAKVLRKLGEYDTEEYAEFKQYDQFAEALATGIIRGDVTTQEPTEEELLEKAKADKIEQIAVFDSSANVNAFTVNGNPMWLTFDERSRLGRSIDACMEETMTKYFGGIPFTYPITIWRKMLNDVELYADQCQTVTEAHKSAVMALSSVRDVEEFDITVDYPEKLAF